MELTKREAELLLKFDAGKPVHAGFDEVQSLTSKHFLLMVSDSPYTWVLSNDGQLAKEKEMRRREQERRESEQERREGKAEIRNETQAKLGVYGFFISIATLLVSIAGLVFSIWSFYN